MKPTDILKQEHRVIEQVLSCLERIAEECEADGNLNGPDAAEAIRFFRTFADRCHHGKEEAHLFPLAEARGIPREGGPVGRMVYEHILGREAIARMDSSLERAAEGVPAACTAFVAAAREYIQLLREHIFKEDYCLFPMADGVFTELDQRNLGESFDRVEESEIGYETHNEAIASADRLAERYGVPKAEVCCACGHAAKM